MKNGKKCSPLRAADGVVLPAARPVSPYSMRGLAQGAGNVYQGAVNATSDAMTSVRDTFGRPYGYTPDVAPAPVAAPVVSAPPAQPALQLGGLNLRVIQRREAAAGLRDGTAFLEGPGGPTDDKIDAKLSHGEAVLPADTVQAIGPHNVRAMIDATHTPTKSKGLRHFANGVDDVQDPRYPAGQQGPSVSTQLPAADPWYKQPPGRVDPSIAPPAPAVTRGPSIPDISAPNVNVDVGKANEQFMPRTRSVLRMSGDDANRSASQGNYGAAFGHALRGGLAMIPAALDDTFMGPGRELAKRFPNVTDQSVNQVVGDAVRTTLTGTDPVVRSARSQGLPAADEVPGRAPPVQTDVQRGGTAAGRPDLDPSTGIYRRGNSFSNTGTYAEDLAPRGAISEQNSKAADNLSAKYAGGLRGGFSMEPNLPAGYGATIPGMNAPASQAESELAARNASVRSTIDSSGISPRTRVAMQEADTHARAVQMQDATTRRGQDVSSDTARMHNASTLRGQDLTYGAATRGQDMTARTAANAARIEQMNKDRQYNFDREKHGDEVAKQHFEIRQQAQKDMHTQVASMLPPGADGKPDTETAARYMTGLNGLVADRQRQLEAAARGGDARAAAALDDLSKNGLAALDPKMVRDHVEGMKVNDLRAQYGSGRFNPIGGTDVITDKPATGLRKSSDGLFGFGGEYTVIGSDGKPQGTIPARAVEGDGSLIGGKRRTDLRDFTR